MLKLLWEISSTTNWSNLITTIQNKHSKGLIKIQSKLVFINTKINTHSTWHTSEKYGVSAKKWIKYGLK